MVVIPVGSSEKSFFNLDVETLKHFQLGRKKINLHIVPMTSPPHSKGVARGGGGPKVAVIPLCRSFF